MTTTTLTSKGRSPFPQLCDMIHKTGDSGVSFGHAKVEQRVSQPIRYVVTNEIFSEQVLPFIKPSALLSVLVKINGRNALQHTSKFWGPKPLSKSQP